MKKEIFFGRSCGQNISVATVDGVVVETDFDGDEHKNLTGNIYKGKVMNVLGGMQAAFVNCGLERNCYLSTVERLNDIHSYDCASGQAEDSAFNIKEGDEILVQVTRPPRGGKGAKVTTKISYVGKNLIYMPHDTFMGISRKIGDEKQKEALLDAMRKLRREDEGMIIRTAAAVADKKTLKRELEYFRRVDDETRKKFSSAKVGELLWQEEELFNRTLRDLFNDSVSKVYVADAEHYEIVKNILLRYGDGSEKKLVYYKGVRDMMSEYNITDQIIASLKPRVPLKSGGNIVLEKTEAMNVIDVNTGKFIGEGNLEETVFTTNLEAAAEIARQVRLRNLGGIIVVDFIDMENPVHRELVTKALDDALSLDRTKSYVLPMSDFCVVEFTRKRINRDVMGLETKKCSNCDGAGYILSDSMIAIKIRGEISDYIADGYNAVVVELNRGVMESILSNRWYSPLLKTKWKGKQVYFIPHRTFAEEKYTIRGDNSGVLHLPDDAQILY